MKREFSAGGLVRKGSLYLIRRPTPNPEYRGNLGWSLPKGWIDAGETPEEAAIREVREEGGVNAKIISKLTTLKLFFTNSSGEKVMKFVNYYLMEYLSDVPQGHDTETEEIRWVTREEALELLAFKSEREMVSHV